MDKVIEALTKLLPLAPQLEKLGLRPETSVAVAAAIIALLVATAKTLLQYLFNRYKNSRAARDLAPFFDYQKVKASRELFIPTQFQNQSPTHEEEPAFSHKFVSKSRLIPFFMNTAFNEKKESDKFYLVLGDSGMGKTTFMINLYVQYTSFFNFGRKYKIRLLPFGDARILEQIQKIDAKEVPQTILLLDAFDEDKKLIPPATPDGLSDDERFRRRLDEVIEAARDFREVVITSRTQYFPGQENEPYELKIPRFDEKGFHKLAKLYLSPFDRKEIKRYLNKKYGRLKFWHRRKKRAAAAIVNNSPKLMVRPMLLSYIDYLVESKQVFKNTYQIYETLIDKWLEREANKRKHQSRTREKFIQDLHQYSRLVALEIYRQRQQTGLHLKKEAALDIAHQNHIDLQDYEITGQSLLTRDVEQNWKFAHKSILEFLVAKQVGEYLELWQELNFDGMDMAEQFFLEKYPGWPLPGTFVLIKGGTFLMGSPHSEVDRRKDETQHQVKVSDFYLAKYPVTQKQWRDIMGSNPSKFKDCDDCPVESVSWNDVQAFIDKLIKKTGMKYRLSTEAEWEYACRAGTTTPFNTGDNLTTEQANYDGNHPYKNYPKGKYVQKTTPVGSYPPNAWGLYDMHGNVYEWCQDWYGEKYYEACKKQGIVENPTGPENGSGRVLRGGSWDFGAQGCRCAGHRGSSPVHRDYFVGFRLVFVP